MSSTGPPWVRVRRAHGLPGGEFSWNSTSIAPSVTHETMPNPLSLKVLPFALVALWTGGCHSSLPGPPESRTAAMAQVSGTESTAAPQAAHGSPLPIVPAVTENSPAVAILAEMLHDNAEYAQHHDEHFFSPFRSGQKPQVTVVGCSDSRFHIGVVDKTPDGKVFVIRNIGNQVDSAEGSVEYAIHHLKTPLLMIIGHVGCGAVKAAMSDYSEESPAIRRELDGLHLSIRRTAAAGTVDQQWLANVQGNVHQQVTDAMREYHHEIADGSLHVVGAVYDFRDDMRQGYGKVVIVNVDGETDPARIEKNALVQFARKIGLGTH